MTRRIPLFRCKRCPHYNGHICNLPDPYPCVEEHNFRIKNRFLAVATTIASILIALCLLCSCGQAPESEPPKHWSAVELLRKQRNELTEWQKLQMAIIYTESRFRPDITGKNQDGGLYQMTPIFVAEVNRIAGTNYTHQDVYDPDKAIEIFNTMHLFKKTNGNFEKALRIHNKSSN